MTQIGTAYVDLKFSPESLAAIGSETRAEGAEMAATFGRSGEEAGARFGSGVLGSVSKLAAGLGGIFAGVKVFDFLKEGVEGAAQLQKSTEAIRANFGQASDSVIKFGDNAAKSFGISTKDSESFATQIGIIGKNLGLGKGQTAEMTIGLQKLAGSIGLIKGQDPSEVFTSLSSALLGNTRGLRSLGIAIDANQIQLEAQHLGLVQSVVDHNAVRKAEDDVTAAQQKVNQAIQEYGKNSLQAHQAVDELRQKTQDLTKAQQGQIQQLTPAQRATAIYALATQHLAGFQQEAAKHSGDLADQEIILRARLSNLADEIGGHVLPVVSQLVGGLDTIIGAPNLSVAIHVAFEGVKTSIGNLVDSIKTALFGSVKDVQLKLPTGKIIGTKEEISKGIFDELKGGIDQINWTSIGGEFAKGLASGNFSNQLFSKFPVAKIFAELLTQVNSNKGTIAKIGLEIALSMISTALDPNFWIANWKTVVGIIISALLLDTGGLGDAIEAALPLTRFIIEPLLKLSGLVKGALGPLGEAVLRGLEDVFPEAAAGARGITSRIIDTFSSLPGRAKTFFLDMARLVGQAIGQMARDVPRIVKDMASDILSILDHLTGGAASKALAIGKAILRAIIDGLGNVGAQVARKLGAVSDAISGVARSVFSKAAAIGQQIYSGIASGLGDLKSLIEGWIREALSHLNPFSPVEHGGELYIGEPIMQGAVNAIRNGAGGLRAAVESTIRGSLGAADTGLQLSAPIQMSTAAAGAAAARAGAVAFNPTIRVYLDGQEVKGRLRAAIDESQDELARALIQMGVGE